MKITMYKIIKPINKCVISVYVETYLGIWIKKNPQKPNLPILMVLLCRTVKF